MYERWDLPEKQEKKKAESKLTSDTNIDISKTDKLLYILIIKWEDGEFQPKTEKKKINQMGKSRTEKRNVNWQQEITYNWKDN